MLHSNGATATISREKLFDVEKEEWRDKAELPTEVTGADGGLRRHNVITVPKENGVHVFCIGGFVGTRWEKHPDHITVLDINTG